MNKQVSLSKSNIKWNLTRDGSRTGSSDTLSEHIGKATVRLELNLMKNVKDAEVPCSKRKIIGSVGDCSSREDTWW